MQQLAVNDQALRRAWESSQRSTKEDWAEWMRHFAVELLKESPSHALRATHLLAQVPHCNSTHPLLRKYVAATSLNARASVAAGTLRGEPCLGWCRESAAEVFVWLSHELSRCVDTTNHQTTSVEATCHALYMPLV